MTPRSRLKKQKVGHGAYSTHKKLERVKAMDRHGVEATSLAEAIKLAGRCHLAPWSASRPSTKNIPNPGAPKGELGGMGQGHGRDSIEPSKAQALSEVKYTIRREPSSSYKGRRPGNALENSLAGSAQFGQLAR